MDFCWQAVVETPEPLGFNQDLFSSKLLSVPKLDDGDDSRGSAHVGGQSSILAKEIINGILTSTSLYLIKSAVTPNEWADLQKKIKVKSAQIFPRRSKRENWDDWKAAIRKKPNRLSTFGKIEGHGINDSETGAWFAVELRDFVAPLLEERFLKINEEGKYIKSLINATYGSISNPFFDFNQPLIAHPIKDIVRCVIWVMIGISNAYLSITDGIVGPLNAMLPHNAPVHLANKRYRCGRPLGDQKWSINSNNKIERTGKLVTLWNGKLLNDRLASVIPQGPFQRLIANFYIVVKGIGFAFPMHGLADCILFDCINNKEILKFRGQTLDTAHFALEAKEGDPPITPNAVRFLKERPRGEGQSLIAPPTVNFKVATIGDFQNQAKETFLAGDRQLTGLERTRQANFPILLPIDIAGK